MPITEEFIPREYPFPLILRTVIPYPENIDDIKQDVNSHPFYKSEIVVDIRDLPLTRKERMALRLLLRGRSSLKEFDPAVDRSFNQPYDIQRVRTHKGKHKRNPFLISFVCRTLPSRRASENGAFWLLDQALTQSKTLAQKFPDEEFYEAVRNELRKHN